jgi:hypothetical protein
VTLLIFRLLVAVMRSRYWALPFLLATSFGARMRYTTLAFLIALPAVLILLSRIVRGELPVHWLWAHVVTTLWLLALSLAFFGLVLGIGLSAPLVKVWRHRNDLVPEGLGLPIPNPKAPSRKSPVPSIALCLLGVVILVVLGQRVRHHTVDRLREFDSGVVDQYFGCLRYGSGQRCPPAGARKVAPLWARWPDLLERLSIRVLAVRSVGSWACLGSQSAST